MQIMTNKFARLVALVGTEVAVAIVVVVPVEFECSDNRSSSNDSSSGRTSHHSSMVAVV